MRDATLAVLPEAPEATIDRTFARLATVTAINGEGQPVVQLRVGSGAVPARLAVPAARERIERAIAGSQPAVVVFEHGDERRPIIIGFVEPIPSREPAESDPSDLPVIEADVDGRRVKVVAKDEIVLQCGAASITLRRNGRVVVRGTYVETHSDGTNRIKGGQVQIN
jgi:hypothetical protein